ncbi:redoxin domain-containing protein [Fusobacterium russii]|uniref:redoxin domain-containing protein n=1 Tax=Fusobacterium russii TaxID=854 RepID=UPI0003A91701|nr:redoxin domain-containing protein [Fusobacterium russii]
MKLESGMKIEDFSFNTQNGMKKSFLSEIKEAEQTILLFLRYIGCPVCNLMIHEINDNFLSFQKKEKKLFVVLQSEEKNLKKELKDYKLNFEIILDPEMKLYKKFSLESAEKKEDLVDEYSMERILLAKESGFVHGEYEGNEMQYPATFIVNKEGVVIFSKYGKTVTDTLSVDDLLNF